MRRREFQAINGTGQIPTMWSMARPGKFGAKNLAVWKVYLKKIVSAHWPPHTAIYQVQNIFGPWCLEMLDFQWFQKNLNHLSCQKRTNGWLILVPWFHGSSREDLVINDCSEALSAVRAMGFQHEHTEWLKSGLKIKWTPSSEIVWCIGISEPQSLVDLWWNGTSRSICEKESCRKSRMNLANQ